MVSGLLIGAIYGLVAMGFAIIYKCSGIFNFAQGDMVVLGAYVCWTMLVPLHLHPAATMLISLFIAFLFGMAIERFALRPLIGESLLVLIMATIALSQIVVGITTVAWGTSPMPYVALFPKGTTSLGFLHLSTGHLWAAGAVFALGIAFALFFRYSPWGLAMRAVAEGHQIVQSMGISINAVISVSWGIAFIIATVGGSLLGSITGFSFHLSDIGIMAIPAAFVGGLNSLPGAILGGMLIGVAEALVTGYVGMATGTPVAFLVLVLVMFFRPYGLFGLKRIERV